MPRNTMMSAIDIELLVVPDCSHQAAAEDLLRTALLDLASVDF